MKCSAYKLKGDDMINYAIRIKDQLLYLHKSSNMFTTDSKQARRYKTYTGAENWIKSRNEINDYNVRFMGLDFIIVEIEELIMED